MGEAETIEHIKKEPGQFSIIFNEYYQAIFGYIYRRTGLFEVSADLASETFLKAFQYLPKYVYKGIAIKVWIYRIASNEINGFYRNQKRARYIVPLSLHRNFPEFQTLVMEDKEMMEKELKQDEQFSILQEGLKQLSQKYQEAISLRYFEGKSIKEIAEILEKKEGTVKSLLSRGAEKLRKICESEYH